MQINKIDPLLNAYPKLSCFFETGNHNVLYDKIRMQISTKLTGLFRRDDEIEQAVANQMELIKKNFHLIKSNFFNVFESMLKPSDYTLVLFQFFLNFIENKVHLYKTNSPEDKDFEAKWNDFRREIAYSRYDRDEKLYLRVQTFLNYLNQQLKNIDQFAALTKQEEAIWEMWKQIFATPDVLDFRVAELADKVNRTLQKNNANRTVTYLNSVYISPIQLRCGSDRIIKRMSDDLPWLFDEIKKILTPYTLIKQDKIFNNSNELLNLVKKNQKYFSVGLEHFYFENICQINNVEFEKSNKLYQLMLEFGGNRSEPTNNFNDGFGNISDHIKICEIMYEYIETIEKVKKNYPDDHQYNLNHYLNRGIGYVKILDNFGITKHVKEMVTLAQFKTNIECLRAAQKCHILVDAYLSAPLENLMSINTAFIIWGMQGTNFDYLKRYDQKDKSAEDLAREIEGTSSEKGKKGRKKPQPRQKREIPALVKKEPPARVIPKPSPQPSCPLPLIPLTKLPTKSVQISSSGTVELSCSLRNLMRSKDNPFILHEYPRAALRQALMYADDLQVIQRNLNNKKGFGITVEVISASYYQMEQMLRYFILTHQTPFDSTFTCDKHNLKALLKQLPDNVLDDLSVPATLYLGNFWVSYPFEQHASWKDLFQNLGREMPKPLCELYSAATNLYQMSPLQSLQGYANKTVSFSKKLADKYFNSPGLSVKILDQEILIFENNPQFNLERVGRCIQCCDKALEQLSSRPHHPAINILKQASYAFKILSEIQDKINTGPLGSDELSYLVRGTIYWQNHILESLLRAILQIQSRSDIAEHDLAQGYQEIKWKQGGNLRTLSMFQKAWAGMNKFSRYPFEVSQAINETHQLILKAELLRERPEFGVGFLEVTQEKCFASPMNFIEVAPVGLKAEEILKELSVLCEGAFVFIEEQALPQIESDLFAF